MASRRNPNRGPSDGPGSFDYQPYVNAFQRLDARLQLAVVLLLLIGGIIAGLIYWRTHRQTQTTPPPIATGNVGRPPGVPAGQSAGGANLLLGNPSGATADPSNRDNYLMVKPYFALSYNSSKGTPNWVSWRVTTGDMGTTVRKQVFDYDTSLPAGFNVVRSADYASSGFDRGHLCPHSDREGSKAMSDATFVMTNIIPQAPNVNQKAWNHMERYCRDLVEKHGQRLYIIAGPVGQGGRGRAGPMDTLKEGKVTVPAECWKVVVVVAEDGGDDDLAKLTASTRVLAVIMPNDEDTVGEEWAQFRVSPATIERRAGLRFFDQVRPDVAEALRQSVDQTALPKPTPSNYGRRGGGGGAEGSNP